MKVAYLFSRYPVPSQTFCDTEIRALEAAGFGVEIYSCSPPTTSFRHGVEDWPRAQVSYAPPLNGLAWWEASARRDGRWPAATIARHETEYGLRYEPAKRARHALYFADRLRWQGVEHLHVHFANRATHAALFIHKLTGIPFSFTAHAQDFLVDLGSDALLGEMCEKAAFVVAVSEWSRRALIEKCPSAEAKIHRVYNGLPLDRWPAPPSIPSRDPLLQIFSVGRLIEFKGFADLIAACGILRERGIPFRCDIAGDGPLREALESQAKDFTEPTARIRMFGLLPQDRIREHLKDCQVFALACKVDEKGACDVLPTVILEAMAAGKPVVSTRIAGVPEMVEDGKTGFLVPAGDPGALADALARLANDPETRAHFGVAGRAKLAAEFSADESARQLGNLMAAAKARSNFASDHSLPIAPGTTTWCLFDQWPMSGQASAGPGDKALVDLCRRAPGTRYLALATGDAPTAVEQSDATFDAVPMLEFMPDALVLETWWRAFGRDAHRLEALRGRVGSACTTDDFLLAARRVLYLHYDLQRGSAGSYHLHAVGPDAMLCAWLLVQIGAANTASFLLDRGHGLTNTTVRRLAPSFVGGWTVGERKLAGSLGPEFYSDQPSSGEWLQAMEAWMEKPLSS